MIRKMLLGLLLLIVSAIPAVAQNVPAYCNATAVYDASTNGSTVLVTGLSGRAIYVCGFSIWAAGTATVGLVHGTGTTCATDETKATPLFSLVTQTGITDSSPSPRGIRVAASRDLCIKTSAGVAVQAIVYYRQQ